MGVFTADELREMQEDQESTMMDECYLLRHIQDFEFGEPIKEDGNDEGPYACGLNMTKSREIRTKDMNVLQTDGQIRLSISLTLDPMDRIKVTRRFGQKITPPLVFAVVGEPQRGPSGLVLDLTIVKPGKNR